MLRCKLAQISSRITSTVQRGAPQRPTGTAYINMDSNCSGTGRKGAWKGLKDGDWVQPRKSLLLNVAIMAANPRFVSPPIAGAVHRWWADPQCRACIVHAAQSPAGVQTAEGQGRAARWGPTESYLGGPYGCPGHLWRHAGLYASECSHQDGTYGCVLHTPGSQGEFGIGDPLRDSTSLQLGTTTFFVTGSSTNQT